MDGIQLSALGIGPHVRKLAGRLIIPPLVLSARSLTPTTSGMQLSALRLALFVCHFV